MSWVDRPDHRDRLRQAGPRTARLPTRDAGSVRPPPRAPAGGGRPRHRDRLSTRRPGPAAPAGTPGRARSGLTGYAAKNEAPRGPAGPGISPEGFAESPCGHIDLQGDRARCRPVRAGEVLVSQDSLILRRTASPSGQRPRLLDPRDLLRAGPGHRRAGPPRDRHQRGLPALRPLAAGLGHRAGLHLGQPRRHRDPRHGRQRRAVRHRDGALLLDRRRPGDGLPRPRDDAVLLRLAGAQRAGVPAPPLQHADATCSTRSTFALSAVLIAGVNLYALALVIQSLLGWPIVGRDRRRRPASCSPTSRSAACRGAIYNEVLQFFVIIAGLIPLVDRRPARRRRLERPEGQGRPTKLGGSASFTPGGARSVGHWTNPLGDWIGIVFGPRLRAVLRLLDDQLRRGAARAVGQGPVAPRSARR